MKLLLVTSYLDSIRGLWALEHSDSLNASNVILQSRVKEIMK